MRSTTTGRSRPRPSYLKKLSSILFFFALTFGCDSLFAQTAGTNPLVRFHTDLGDMDVLLLKDIAPNNVANFLGYVNPGIYDNSFFHRSVLAFVIQGGGYNFVNNQVNSLAQHAAVVNEFHVSNKRGTLAMAKLPNNPNSATNQWFFNESDFNSDPSNPNDLDTQNGGFTVFARIINSTGLTTMDTIANVPVYNAGTGFESLPLLNYVSGNVQNANLVHVIWVKVVPQVAAVTHPSANTIHLQGIGGASKTYQLQTSTTPASSGFTTLTTVTADANGVISFNDNSAGTKKFYRLAIP